LPLLPLNLENLFCSDNQLTSVDIRGLNELKYLWCFGNKMKSPDDVLGFINGEWDGAPYNLNRQSYFRFVPQNTTQNPDPGDDPATSVDAHDGDGIFGTRPKWTGKWWHYVLFFVFFGWIWMYL